MEPELFSFDALSYDVECCFEVVLFEDGCDGGDVAFESVVECECY